MSAHLLSTADPYTPSGEVRALCGKQIHSPEIQFQFDEVPTGQKLDVSSLAVCKQCQLQAIPSGFVYAIAEVHHATSRRYSGEKRERQNGDHE